MVFYTEKNGAFRDILLLVSYKFVVTKACAVTKMVPCGQAPSFTAQVAEAYLDLMLESQCRDAAVIVVIAVNLLLFHADLFAGLVICADRPRNCHMRNTSGDESTFSDLRHT